MGIRQDLAINLIDSAKRILDDNLKSLKLEEALFVPQGGYRSIIGTLKHMGGWSYVYCSYAFDPSPVSWQNLDWPHKLKDTVIKSESYLKDLIVWLDQSIILWKEKISQVGEDELEEQRPLHWGETMRLFDIIRLISHHFVYHAGEINQLLSIYRQEAWEEGEQVEENVIASEGHRVIPPWMQE